MNRVTNWLYTRLIDSVTIMTGLLIIETFAMILGEPHAFKPKGRLGRFLYTSEAAKVPRFIGIMLVLGFVIVADAVLGLIDPMRGRTRSKDSKAVSLASPK